MSIVGALAATVVLGLVLVPRWPHVSSLAVTGRSQPVIAVSSADADVATPNGAADVESSVASATTVVRNAGDPGVRKVEVNNSQSGGRPSSRSSPIDVQTVAAARDRADVLAGKRPAVDSPQPPPTRESAVDIASAPANDHASPTNEMGNPPRSSSPRTESARSAARVSEPPVPTHSIEWSSPPRPMPARENVAAAIASAPPTQLASRANEASNLPPSTSPRADSARSSAIVAAPPAPASRLDLLIHNARIASLQNAVPQAVPRPRESPGAIVSRDEGKQGANGGREQNIVATIPGRTASQADRAYPETTRRSPPVTPARPQTDFPPEQNVPVATGSPRVIASSPQQDAEARLEESWERRERWLRERLQPR